MTNQQIPQRRISQPTAVCWKPLSRRLEPSHKEFEDFLPGCTGFSCFPRMVSGQQDLYYMMYMFCTCSFSRCLWSFMLFNNYWVGGVPKSWNFKMRKLRLSGNCLANAAQQKTHAKKKRSSHDGHCSSELLSTLCWGGSFTTAAGWKHTTLLRLVVTEWKCHPSPQRVWVAKCIIPWNVQNEPVPNTTSWWFQPAWNIDHFPK